MDINKMTRKELFTLPHRKWDEEIICDSIIILPTREKHSSGYLCMDFVAVKGNEPICLLSGCSDVIHVDGIGGYGHNWYYKNQTVPELVSPTGWSIDCLPNGLLRMWPASRQILCMPALSSFEIYALEEKP